MLDGVYGTFMVSELEKQECVCGSYFTTDDMNWLANIVIPSCLTHHFTNNFIKFPKNKLEIS